MLSAVATMGELSGRQESLNPWLCPDLEMISDVLCGLHGLCFPEEANWNETTCNISSLLVKTLYPSLNATFVDLLGASHTLLATEVIVHALEDLLANFVRQKPDVTGEQLPTLFRQFAQGPELKKAISNVRLGVKSGYVSQDGYLVFSEGFHRLSSPSYFLLFTNRQMHRQDIVGSWTLANESTSSGRVGLLPHYTPNWGSLGDRDLHQNGVPVSSCIPLCSPGKFVHTIAELDCCHECLSCGGRNFSNSTLSPQCFLCDEHFLALDNHTGCYPMPEKTPRRLVIVLTTLGGAWSAMIALLVATARIFYTNRSVRLIQENLIFNQLVFIAMVMCLLTSAIYSVPVTTWLCRYRSLLPTPWYTLSVASLLVKTARLAYVVTTFRAGSLRKVVSKAAFQGAAQLIFVFLPTVIAVLLQIILTLLEPTDPKPVYSDVSYYKVCERQVGADITIDGYLLLLLLITNVLAFRIRKLPSHLKDIFHREARPLFFVSLCLSAIWTIISALRAISKEETADVLVMIRTISFVGALWGWLFLPKIYGLRRGWHLRFRGTRSVDLSQTSTSSAYIQENPVAMRTLSVSRTECTDVATSCSAFSEQVFYI